MIAKNRGASPGAPFHAEKTRIAAERLAQPQHPVQRFGDLLPLPLPRAPARPTPASRAAVRRWHRARLIYLESCETVFGLNSLAGHAESSWPADALNAAQSSSLNLIHREHSRQGPTRQH